LGFEKALFILLTQGDFNKTVEIKMIFGDVVWEEKMRSV